MSTGLEVVGIEWVRIQLVFRLRVDEAATIA